MGLSCKPWGKFGADIKKLDNELKAKEDAIKHKSATGKNKKESKEKAE